MGRWYRARRSLALSSRDLADDEDHNENGGETDDHDKDYVYHKCDSFLDKCPPSLRMLRIDRAGKVLLNGLKTIPTAVRKKTPSQSREVGVAVA